MRRGHMAAVTIRTSPGRSLCHFKQTARTLRKYLQALEDICLLQKLSPHEASVANEAWLPFDTGIATQLMESAMGEGRSLSLGRIFVLKEIRALTEYAGKRIQPLYYKSARPSPVDLIWTVYNWRNPASRVCRGLIGPDAVPRPDIPGCDRRAWPHTRPHRLGR